MRPGLYKYYPGETDAIVRRVRGYRRVIDDDETPDDRKPFLLAAIADDLKLLDDYLSSGKPLPSQWVEGRSEVASPAQDGDAVQPEPKTPGSGKSKAEKGKK